MFVYRPLYIYFICANCMYLYIIVYILCAVSVCKVRIVFSFVMLGLEFAVLSCTVIVAHFHS